MTWFLNERYSDQFLSFGARLQYFTCGTPINPFGFVKERFLL